MSIPTPAEWGERLRRYRLNADLTQIELAARAGRSQTTVSQAENGLVRPDAETQVAFADALGVSVTELFPRSEEEAALPEQAARCTGGH